MSAIMPLSQAAGGSFETAASAVAAQAKALVEARYVIALRNPRDMDAVRERLMKECRRPSFAAVARYRKPVGKGIEGPSIRFAEAAIRCMTNITVETVTVYDDREKRIVRVAVTDLEANVPYSQDVTIEKTVERRKAKDGDAVIRTRTNSHGDTVYVIEAIEDDILNKQNALISKAVRTLGLRLVPGDLIDEGMDAVVKTQRDADAKDPDGAKRQLLDAFAGLGVKVDQVKAYLGHSADTLTPKELAELRALYSALRDGETTWREVMDSRPEGDAPKPTEPKAPPVYSAEAFAKNLPTWTGLIRDGKKTAEEIITTVESKAVMTEEQKGTLRAVKPVSDAPQFDVEAAASGLTKTALEN